MNRIAVNTQNAATMCGLSESQVKKFIRSNLLRSRKIGRRRLILVDDLRKFVRSDQPEPKAMAK